MQNDSSELLEILEEERALLLDGEVQALGELIPRKTAAVAALGDQDAEILADLQAFATRNEELLQSAIAGVKSARERLEGRKGHDGFQTYTAQGNRQVIGSSRPKFERRK